MHATQLTIKVHPQIIRDFQISLFVLLNITGSRIGFKTVQEICHIEYDICLLFFCIRNKFTIAHSLKHLTTKV